MQHLTLISRGMGSFRRERERQYLTPFDPELPPPSLNILNIKIEWKWIQPASFSLKLLSFWYLFCVNMLFLTLVDLVLPQKCSQNRPIRFFVWISYLYKMNIAWEDRSFVTLLTPKCPPLCPKMGQISNFGKRLSQKMWHLCHISAFNLNWKGYSHWQTLFTLILPHWCTERA